MPGVRGKQLGIGGTHSPRVWPGTQPAGLAGHTARATTQSTYPMLLSHKSTGPTQRSIFHTHSGRGMWHNGRANAGFPGNPQEPRPLGTEPGGVHAFRSGHVAQRPGKRCICGNPQESQPLGTICLLPYLLYYISSTTFLPLSFSYYLSSTIFRLLSCFYYISSTIFLLLSFFYYRASTIFILLSCFYYPSSAILLLLSFCYYRSSTIVLLLSCFYYLSSTVLLLL